MRKSLFPRNLEARAHLDLMLVSAVSSVLVIRFALAVTGYPKLGGDALHIAHMLWGGLFMLAALVLLLAFHGEARLHAASLLGGVGFGTFIDEIGKFVTHDNDYFYRPSVAILYVIFVLLYLLTRRLYGRSRVSGQEYLVNAMQGLTEVALRDLDAGEQRRSLDYLERSDASTRLKETVGRLLHEAELVPNPRPGFFGRMYRTILARYRAMAGSVVMRRLVIAFFVLQTVGWIVRLIPAQTWLPDLGITWARIPFVGTDPNLPDHPLPLVRTVTTLASGGLVALGISFLVRDRARAFRFFEASVLVHLFLTQVFVFYRAEWLGLVELLQHLVVLAVLRLALAGERSLDHPSPT